MNFATCAQNDLAAAQQARTKLIETLPHYREQAKGYADMPWASGRPSKDTSVDSRQGRLP